MMHHLLSTAYVVEFVGDTRCNKWVNTQIMNAILMEVVAARQKLCTTNPAVRRSRYFFRIILDYQAARTGHIVLKVISIAAKR